jgi:flagellar L-ring protein precursor FlgH
MTATPSPHPIRWFVLTALLVSSPAQAQDAADAVAPELAAATEPAPRPSADLPDATTLMTGPAPGNLWNERNARAMLGQDGNTREVGDLVTVNIYESISSSLAADTETSRKSTIGAKISAMLGLENNIIKANPTMGPDISIGTESDSSYSGSGTTSSQTSLQGQLTCEVVEVLPTGNLRIYGSKEVRANRETQHLVLEGIVRPKDIRADNTVASYLLAEARIENSGSGVLSDKQGPGVGQRIIDRVWPF